MSGYDVRVPLSTRVARLQDSLSAQRIGHRVTILQAADRRYLDLLEAQQFHGKCIFLREEIQALVREVDGIVGAIFVAIRNITREPAMYGEAQSVMALVELLRSTEEIGSSLDRTDGQITALLQRRFSGTR
ncbi:hypothetical protein RUND412_004935 [Rhizina undulata]